MTAVLTDSRALVTVRGARAIVVLPVDSLRSTIDARSKTELHTTSIDVQTTGRVGDRQRGEMKVWTLRDRIPPAR